MDVHVRVKDEFGHDEGVLKGSLEAARSDNAAYSRAHLAVKRNEVKSRIDGAEQSSSHVSLWLRSLTNIAPAYRPNSLYAPANGFLKEKEMV